MSEGVENFIWITMEVLIGKLIFWQKLETERISCTYLKEEYLKQEMPNAKD